MARPRNNPLALNSSGRTWGEWVSLAGLAYLQSPVAATGTDHLLHEQNHLLHEQNTTLRDDLRSSWRGGDEPGPWKDMKASGELDRMYYSHPDPEFRGRQ